MKKIFYKKGGLRTMENRNHKDSLFIDLFCKDKKIGKENFISLYNALHQTNLDLKNTTLEEVNIENILYMALSNDIAMLVDNRLIVLVEHQSTINENMPLRLLEYVSRIYEQIVPAEDRYEKKMIKIPYPEFYVFYNGIEEYPVEKELRLSDAFILPDNKYSKEKQISLEILVKVININIDKENPILKQCRALQEYSTLIELIRENKRQNPNTPLKEALSKAINDGILSDYLKRKTTEVRNMLIAEYSYETDIKVQRREAFRLGKEEGAIEAAKNLLKYGDPIEKITIITGLPLEKVQQLEEEINQTK